MTSEVKHTPGPFRYEWLPASYVFKVSGVGGILCYTKGVTAKQSPDVLEANAAFIVTACNSHYPMLEALEEVTHEVEAALRCVTNHETRAEMQTKATKARAAIRLAKGGV